MSNIPNYEQWAKMNEYLNDIAVSLGSDIDVSTWAGVRSAVRMGLAPSIFPVGTQFTVSHSVYGDMLFDVVAHNHFKSAKDENAPTMTLQCRNIITTLSYDIPELFCMKTNLPAGTYNFTLSSAYSSWAKGTYQFTLTKPMSWGLGISGNAGTALTSLKVVNYDTMFESSLIIESVAIISGSGGTSLGTFGVELNHAHRVSYGSDNYKESAIRGFINGTGTTASVDIVKNRTKYKRVPSWADSLTPFQNGLDSEFLSCVGEVILPCATNDIYESPDSTTKVGEKYTLTDKFYLASQKELFGTSVNAIEDDSVIFPYYIGAVDADRVKYQNSVAKHWWTRSPRTKSATLTHAVLNSGGLSNNHTSSEYGVVPCCTIV